MAYDDLGYDPWLQRANPPGVQASGFPQMNPQMTDYLMQSISGSKVNGGVMVSSNGQFVLDLNNGYLKVNNGSGIDLITLGTLSDGSIGLEIKDNNGNTILEFSTTTALLQSSDGHMFLDFIAEQLGVSDVANNLVVLLGQLD